MLRILKFIFTGDWHLCKWETINDFNVMRADGKIASKQYHCKCSICGRHKKFD